MKVFFAALTIVSISTFTSAQEFVISYWCGPPAKFNTLERYQEIKDANFTVAFPSCSGMSVEENRKMLDHCQKVGLKAMVMDSRMVHAIAGKAENKAALDAIVNDYGDHPALFGYHIVDEPGAGAFAGLAEVVAFLKEKDPKHPGYINLLPTYGRDFNVLGTKTYDEYVRKYAETVKPFAISYDHYHFTNHGDRADFFENLETVRKVALESNTPFWNIVLCTKHGDYRHLTEPELRFEAMQTLAYGGKGLLWFTYWLPSGPDFPGWDHAMINAEGKKDPHYDMIKAINADVQAIGSELLKAKSTNVAAKENLTIGTFDDGNGKTLTLYANRDYKNALDTQAAVEGKPVEQFDPQSRKWSPAEKTEAGVALKISPGGAVLLRW